MTTNNGTPEPTNYTLPSWFEELINEDKLEQEERKSLGLTVGIQDRAVPEEVHLRIKTCVSPPKTGKKSKRRVSSIFQMERKLKWSEMNGSDYMHYKMELQGQLMNLKKGPRLFKKTKLLGWKGCDMDPLDKIMHENEIGLRHSTAHKTCKGIEQIVLDMPAEEGYDSWFEDDSDAV